MKKKYFLFLSLLLCSHEYSFSQKFHWEKPVEAGLSCYSFDIDSKNNMLFVGLYTKVYPVFDTTVLPKLPEHEEINNLFIAQTDTALRLNWLKIIESGFCVINPILKIDKSDNIILVGLYKNGLKIDSLEIKEENENLNGFMAKFDNYGNLLWFNKLTYDNYIYGLFINDVAIDNENNIYLAGDYGSYFTINKGNGIDTTLRSNTSIQSGFIIKFNENGNRITAKSTNNIGWFSCQSIALDSDQSVYTTGYWTDTLIFAADTFNSKLDNIFISKFNNKFELEWFKQIGTDYHDISESGYSVTTDQNGNVYATGSFVGTVYFDNKILNGEYGNIFLVKYDSNGNLKWVRQAGGPDGFASYVEKGKKVFVDNKGFIYLMGVFGLCAPFGDTTICAYNSTEISNLGYDVFVAKYYANGELSWATHAGVPSYDDNCFSMKNDNMNHTFITGDAQSGAIFGDFIFSPFNISAGYIAKITDKVENNKFDLITNNNEYLEANYLSVFPNPFSGIININLKAYSDENINLLTYSADGKLVYSKRFEAHNGNNNFICNTENLESGMYVIKIIMKDKILTKTMIKK